MACRCFGKKTATADKTVDCSKNQRGRSPLKTAITIPKKHPLRPHQYALFLRKCTFSAPGFLPHSRANAKPLTSKDTLLSRKTSRVCKGCSWIWGPAPPPCPRVNAGRLIPNGALTGIKSAEIFYETAPIPFRKRRRGFWMWGLWFVGLLAPRPRQHGMLQPKGCPFGHKGFAGLQGIRFGYGGSRRLHAPT